MNFFLMIREQISSMKTIRDSLKIMLSMNGRSKLLEPSTFIFREVIRDDWMEVVTLPRVSLKSTSGWCLKASAYPVHPLVLKTKSFLHS